LTFYLFVNCLSSISSQWAATIICFFLEDISDGIKTDTPMLLNVWNCFIFDSSNFNIIIYDTILNIHSFTDHDCFKTLQQMERWKGSSNEYNFNSLFQIEDHHLSHSKHPIPRLLTILMNWHLLIYLYWNCQELEGFISLL
jgi:hypothetical protein